jgi:hypothetical protein
MRVIVRLGAKETSVLNLKAGARDSGVGIVPLPLNIPERTEAIRLDSALNAQGFETFGPGLNQATVWHRSRNPHAKTPMILRVGILAGGEGTCAVRGLSIKI